MVSVGFSKPTGRDALHDLPNEAQRSAIQKAEAIESDPYDELVSDSGYKEYYCTFETTQEEYMILARWDWTKDFIRIFNIGPADSFRLGN
jgi:hypothetical protein